MPKLNKKIGLYQSTWDWLQNEANSKTDGNVTALVEQIIIEKKAIIESAKYIGFLKKSYEPKKN